MNEQVEILLQQLKYITPTNIHLKTDANLSLQDSFHSVWFRHSPQSARYMLLPYLYDGRVKTKL